MREDHRRLRDADRVAHRVGVRVREIHQHPDPVHLVDDLLAELRQTPVAGRRVHRGVRPGGVAVVRQRHVAHAQAVVHAQQREGILDRVSALRAQHPADPAGRLGRADVRGRGRECERVRITRDHATRDVDLLELGAREVRLRLARGVHGPEYRADAARPQARNIGLAVRGRLRADVVGLDVAGRRLGPANRPRQIVVPVEEDGFREHFPRVLERGIGVCAAGAK
jgi:hypothetical protein